MRTYETIFIVHPENTGDAFQQLLDRYREILTQQNAIVHKFEDWGVRRLAYPLAKQTKGAYVLAVFDCLPAALNEFERRLRLDEMILKYQSVHLEKYVPVEPQAQPAAGEAEGTAPEAPEEGADEEGEEEEED
ncbi:MAG: 30S ribosomal protein S6 [Desulfuromonadaceae bacterium]|jgi:small subunit ribosomal protein S6|nr:30S ribosomal protein S6 [Desulfuromonadaceae bacterium]